MVCRYQTEYDWERQTCKEGGHSNSISSLKGIALTHLV